MQYALQSVQGIDKSYLPMCHSARGALVCGVGLHIGLILMSGHAVAQAAPTDGVEFPQVVRRHDALYPSALNQPAPRGNIRVLLDVSIDDQGHVVAVDVAESGGEAFDAAALLAMKEWTFKPALRRGKPVPARIQVPFDFAPPEPAAEPEPTSDAQRDGAEGTPEPRSDSESAAASDEPIAEVVVSGEHRAPSQIRNRRGRHSTRSGAT